MWIFNKEETVLDEAMRGMLFAEPGKYKRLDTEYGYGISLVNLKADCVRIILDGGGGYGAMWAGFAQPGLGDAIVQGNFNCAPNAYVLYEMAKQIDAGKGVLFLCNHFMGDYLNNDMALELLEHEGINARACYISDDICSASGEPKENRGGLHGIAQVCKIAANAAAKGCSLEEVYRLAEKANERLRSISLEIDKKNQILVGPGFSGEPPVEKRPFVSADQFVELALEKLLEELKTYDAEPVYLNINRMRRMCFTEGFVVLHAAKRYLEKRGVRVCGGSVGCYFDVFPLNGCMFSLLSLDSELQDYFGVASGYDFTV